MEKLDDLQRIVDRGIVAVVRAENAEKALAVAEAIKAAGIDIIEITLTVPGCMDVIRELARAYSGKEVLIGAGTVLDPETARTALLSGAEFVVSPHLNPETVRLCNRYQKVCIPGAMSVTEVVQAMECGADIVKVFPGSVLGVEFVKAVKAPLPQAPLLPTGGVSLDNVGAWLKAGCVAVGVGGELTKGAKTGDYAQVTATAEAFMERIREARA
jgi:2-dehydro-3-deoxyphosphogluconate aldolase / (4S)-4-hydroxy-2-oxoglutarate aldolase